MYRRFCITALLLLTLLSACAPASAPVTATPQAASTDLDGIKTYLTGKISALKTSSAALQVASTRYTALANAAKLDYTALAAQPAEAAQALADAKAAWMQASPLYEQMEGIVAGVPSLSEFDVILDAGASGAEDPENAAPYDLALSDGRVLPKPGNLFGVLESTLWGTEPAFRAAEADLNANGSIEFGEALPDALVLQAAADTLVAYTGQLETAAAAWQPTEAEAFTALVVMIPTMNEYFNSWKASRFVSGDSSSQRDFVAISRLADIQDILGSLQIVYKGIRPLVERANPEQAAQIEESLASLKNFVADIHNREKGGQRFSAEEADLLGAEAQNRATALAGQIAQIAAQLNISITE